MDNLFHNLNMKWWHTVLLATSFFIFVLSITVELKGIDNLTLSFLSSGTFFISLGYFACQSFIQALATWRGTNGILEKDIFKPNIPGILLILIGIYLLFKGIM